MTDKNLADLTNPEDYERLDHLVLMRNESSGTTINDPELISIVALDAEGVFLRVPKTSSKKGQSVTLFFFRDTSVPLDKKVPVEGTIKDSIECVGKVIDESLYEEEPEIKLIRVDLTQTEANTWKRLTDQYLRLEGAIAQMFEEGEAT